MKPRFLTVADVLAIHANQILHYGGRHGVRDHRLLASAVATPRAGTLEGYVHTDLHEMAAAYLFHIVRNHPFIDGNKRVGAVAALVFLELNGIRVDATDDELVATVLGVAGGSRSKSGAAEFLRSRST